MTELQHARPRRRLVTRAVAAGVAGLLGVLAAVHGSAFADPLSDQRRAAEQKAAENKAARERVAASLEGINAELAQAVLDLQVVEQRLPVAQAELATAEDTLQRTEREAELIAARLVDAEEQETTIGATIAADTERGQKIRVAIGQMAREAYKGGSGTSSMDIVLDAESTEDFIAQYGLVTTALRTQTQALDELRAIEAQNRNSQARLTAVRTRITELKAEADQKVVEADAARDEAAARKAEVEQLIVEQAAKKATIEAQKSAAEAEQARMDAEAAAISAELASIAAQQKAAAEAAAAAARAAGRPAPAPAAPGPVGRGLFQNPTSISPAYVTSEYGMRLHPTLGYVRLHAGIDLRTYCGTPLYAGRSGTVQWAQYRFGFGNQVMIDHGLVNGNSLMSSYNHMTRFVVGGGEQVSAGQLIGYSGNTGTSAACHLHLEVYLDGNTTNPRPLLGM
ncbi:peptidoglycan DD-metalloendopeptidase family protein [Cellulomonas sp. NS3]|uniref:peptidoglycan DD-metalloendopeptidase family protein n=1 Tax=Cellulomonas sp. NS3 TaxID=2973977 RepID=UPI002163D903|nr:peptidoglycan DD-metalloendopeptidase family protein [Cellulomonas sp. NS3]